MWKAGTAVFTMLLNNVFARIAGSSSKTVSDLNLEFSPILSGNALRKAFSVCSQFPLQPAHRGSALPAGSWRNPRGMAQAGIHLCVSLRNGFHFHTWCPRMRQRLSLSSFPALPFLPSSMLNSASWRKMCLKSKGFCTLLARIKMQMKSETWGRWEHLTLCLSQCHDAEDHKSHLSLKTSTFSCPH